MGIWKYRDRSRDQEGVIFMLGKKKKKKRDYGGEKNEVGGGEGISERRISLPTNTYIHTQNTFRL